MTSFAALARVAVSHEAQVFLFGLLLAANEANLAIRAVFNSLDLKPRSPATAGDGGVIDVGEFNRGRIMAYSRGS